jgi:hypothetical protein
MTLPIFNATTLMASPTLNNHQTFLEVSFYTSFGWKDVGCTLMPNTPPAMFSNKLGWLS